MKALQVKFILEELRLTEKNLIESLDEKQEHLNNNVVILQSEIEQAMREDEMFRLKVVNKALSRENKQLKEQILIMGEAQVNKAKEKKNGTNG